MLSRSIRLLFYRCQQSIDQSVKPGFLRAKAATAFGAS